MDWLLQHMLQIPLDDDVFDALNTKQHRYVLQINPHLTEHQFDVLWEKNLPVRIASSLCAQARTPAQVDRVLREEKRGSVLAHLLDNNQLTSDQQRHILTEAKGSQYAYRMLQSPNFDRSLLTLAANHFRGSERLEWCAANSTSISEDEAFAAYQYCETDQGMRQLRDVTSFSQALMKLLTTFPGLTARIIDSGSPCRIGLVQLAASRFLTSRAHQERIFEESNYSYPKVALAANPVVALDIVERLGNTADQSTADQPIVDAVRRRLENNPGQIQVPFESIDERDHIEWVLRRVLPSKFREHGRSWDLPAIAMNPNLTENETKRVYAVLKAANPRTLAVPAANAALAVLEQRLGVPTAKRLTETGFWDEMFQYADRTADRSDRWWEENWILDPSLRPWTPAAIEAARASISHEHLVEVTESNDPAWHRLDRPAVHAYLASELQTPAQWVMFMNLLPSHTTAPIKRTVATAQRLAR